MGARKAVADVMGTARSDHAGLQTKLSNENGYAVNKMRAVFGDQPTSAILDELGQAEGPPGDEQPLLGRLQDGDGKLGRSAGGISRTSWPNAISSGAQWCAVAQASMPTRQGS